MFSQRFSNSTMEIKVALVFWKLKHHCPNTFYYKIYDKETFFSAEIYLFSFYMQIDFIYSVCLKKIMTPPAWSTRKAVNPLYQFPIFSWPPHYLFATPLAINNDGPLVIRGKLASQYLILIFHIVDFMS